MVFQNKMSLMTDEIDRKSLYWWDHGVPMHGFIAIVTQHYVYHKKKHDKHHLENLLSSKENGLH